MASSLRAYILDQVRMMEVGEHLVVERKVFADAFGPHWMQLDRRPAIDAFLESLPGANYGTFTAEDNPENGNVLVRKHEAKSYRVREDWDRR